jgi:hypothetical protein
MRGRLISPHYALRDACEQARNKKLGPIEWKRNIGIARRQGRMTIIKKNKEGLEYSFALVDKDRKITKKAMMTPLEAYRRNKVTKLMGLAWVLCG